MICKPDTSRRRSDAPVRKKMRIGLAILVSALLAACDENASDLPPLERARQALTAGNGLGAELALRGAMDGGELSRTDVAALMGEAELLQGEYSEARQWLAPGEFSDATLAHGFHMLGKLEFVQGNLPAAGAAFDRAYAEGGEDAGLWVDVGRLRYRGGEQLQAIEAADMALVIEPGSAAALQFKGQLIRDSLGPAAARPWFVAALKAAPKNAEIISDQAATQGEAGRGRRMLRLARRAYRADPGNKRLNYLQAVLAARGGKLELAQSLLQRSDEKDRNSPAAVLLSAVIDMRNGNYASSSQTLERLSSEQPHNRDIQNLFARSLALGKNEPELIYRFGDIARRPSASPYLQTLVGRAHEALGQREEAAWYLDRASKPRSHNLVALQPLSGVLDEDDVFASTRQSIVSGNSTGARRSADELAKRFPGSADVLGIAGDARMASGDPKGALNYYRKAAAVRRSWSLAKRMLAVHRAKGELAEAEQLLISFVRGEPGNAEATSVLAGMLAAKGDWKRVAPLIDHALAHGASRDANLVALRARAASGLGEHAKALRLAREAHSLAPMSAIASEMLATLEGQDDDAMKAKEVLLEKARKLSAT